MQKWFKRACNSTHEELTAQEYIAIEYNFGSELVVYDNYLMQYELGYMSEDYWERTIADIKCSFEHPFYRQALDGWIFREKFQELIDELMVEALENPTGCWKFEWGYPIAE
jgi:hypothetical protein